MYFIAVNGERQGPFLLHELAAQGLRFDTLVWREGMADWAPAQQVQELREILSPPGPPVPQSLTYGRAASSYPRMQAVAPGGVRVPILVSAIINCIALVFWGPFLLLATCGLGVVLLAPLLILVIFEFTTYAELGNPHRPVTRSKIQAIAICEIIAGTLMMTVAPLVCGIIVLASLGQLRGNKGV